MPLPIAGAGSEELFHAALERDPPSRLAFLQEACGADTELFKDVESLLRFSRESRSTSCRKRDGSRAQYEIASGQPAWQRLESSPHGAGKRSRPEASWPITKSCRCWVPEAWAKFTWPRTCGSDARLRSRCCNRNLRLTSAACNALNRKLMRLPL